jgi:hypothetical protein
MAFEFIKQEKVYADDTSVQNGWTVSLPTMRPDRRQPSRFSEMASGCPARLG